MWIYVMQIYPSSFVPFDEQYLIFLMFIYFERESGGGSKREGERESQAGSAPSGQSPTQGLLSRTMRLRSEPRLVQSLTFDPSSPGPI